MKYILPSLFMLSMLVSCASPRKYAATVGRGYLKGDKTPVVRPDNIQVTYDGPDINGADVTVKKMRGSFVPALFYWRLREKQACTMKSRLPFMAFERQFYATADSLKLDTGLHGGRLNVRVSSFPLRFTFSRRVDLIYGFVFYYMWSDQYMQLDSTAVNATYDVAGGTKPYNGGRAMVPVGVAAYHNNHNTKKYSTLVFMKKYYSFSEDLGRQCALQIYDQLK